MVDSRCAMISVVRPCAMRSSSRLDGALGARVERRRGLVEDHQRRVLQEGARDRDALLLAARKLHAALADHGVVLLRQRQDELVHLRRLGRLDHLGHAGAERGRSAML